MENIHNQFRLNNPRSVIYENSWYYFCVKLCETQYGEKKEAEVN